MTNEEKSREIGELFESPYLAALEMAEWKDQQFNAKDEQEAYANTLKPHLSKIITEKIQSLTHHEGSIIALDENDEPYRTYSMDDLFSELPHTVYMCNVEGKGVHAYIHAIDHYYGIVTYETADHKLALIYTGDKRHNWGLMQALGTAICDIETRRKRSGVDMVIMTTEEEKRLLN